MKSPYSDLEPRAFWRSAVTARDPLDPGDLYRPKFPVTREMRIVTAGSCFAQHVGRTLAEAQFNVVDAEPFPVAMAPEIARRFGYGLYSARYGNIYTARQLLQLVQEVQGSFTPACPVWERDGRFFDALRPNVEPEGLDSPEQVAQHRALHLAAVRKAFRRADLFVFTFGLTETWEHRTTGTVYPTAPGTIAGDYDPEVFAFRNLDYDEVLGDFRRVMKILTRHNPAIRFLVTTSPVPLTATASGEHVEVATCQSKAVLRAVCGTLARQDNVDYFPSYEIITSANARGAWFRSNQREVSPQGVKTAMDMFLTAHGAAAPVAGAGAGAGAESGAEPGPEAGATPAGPRAAGARRRAAAAADEDVVCEEILLEAFAR